MKFTTTNFSSNPVLESREKATKYVNELTSQALEKLKEQYPDVSEYKIAEIALTACSTLLELHFHELARYGKSPTD